MLSIIQDYYTESHDSTNKTHDHKKYSTLKTHKNHRDSHDHRDDPNNI